MPDADWSASRASSAKPTAQGGIYVLGDGRLPTTGKLQDHQCPEAACCPVTHLGLVNPNTDKLYSVKDKRSRLEFFLFKPCLIVLVCSTAR